MPPTIRTLGTGCLAVAGARDGAFFADAVVLAASRDLAVAAALFAVAFGFLSVDVLAVLFILGAADAFFDGVIAFFFPADALRAVALVFAVDALLPLGGCDVRLAAPAFFLLVADLAADFFGPWEVARAAFFCVDFFLLKAITRPRGVHGKVNPALISEPCGKRNFAARPFPPVQEAWPAWRAADIFLFCRIMKREPGIFRPAPVIMFSELTPHPSKPPPNMPLRVATRVADIQPFHVMDILARARELERQGRSIVHMEIGEPDFPTPQPITAAGKRALDEGHTHYTPALGLPALREAIARDYHARYGVSVSPRRIIVTPGASGALLLAMALLVEPGSRVLMPDPGYPCNRHFVRLMEGRAVSLPAGPDTDYQITPEALEARWSPDAAAALMASPANPTGAVAGVEALTSISRTVDTLGGTLILDETYHGLTYSGPAPSVLQISDEAIVINSFSKYFGMTGWRLGWMVVPERYVSHVDKLAQNIFLSAPSMAQHAALAAFAPQTMDILEQRRSQFMQRRDFLLPALRSIGFEITGTPRGAFYLYAGCRRFCRDSYDFARDLLDEAGVAITPGLDFGSRGAEGHVRFAYTTSIDQLREGVRRLGKYLGESR